MHIIIIIIITIIKFQRMIAFFRSTTQLATVTSNDLE